MSAPSGGPGVRLDPFAASSMDAQLEPTPAWLSRQLGGTAPSRLANYSDWNPGDLLLFSPLVQDPISGAIINTQLRAGADPGDAEYSHVGVYHGDGKYVDASPWRTSGLRDDLAAEAEHGYIRVRRVSLAQGYTAAHGQLIADQASNYANRRYGLWTAVKIWLDSHLRTLTGRALFAFINGEARAYVCSVLAEIAVENCGLVAQVRALSSTAPLPFIFLESDLFDDVVPVGWRAARL